MKKGNLVITILFCLAVLFIPMTADAKSSVSKMEMFQEYHFDFTGDGTEDTVKIKPIKMSQGESTGIELYVNKVKVYSNSNPEIVYWDDSNESKRIQLANGKNYVAIVLKGYIGSNLQPAIFGYKDNKFKKLVDLYAFKKLGGISLVDKITTTNNTIHVKYTNFSFTLSAFNFTLPYKYSKGELIQSKTIVPIKRLCNKKTYWTANKKIKVYKKATGKKKVTTIRKGKKVKVDKMYIDKNHKKILFHVKVKGGKSGWVKGYTNYPKTKMFKEVMYWQ